MKKKLVIFDFDGTLTYKDSMLEFTRFYVGNFRFLRGMLTLMPVLLLYKVGCIPNWRAKEYFLTYFFRNESNLKFQKRCDRFSLEKIPEMIRPSAFRQLEEHQKNNDQLAIVSSSAENWLRAWCRQKGINLLATQLQVGEGRLSGKLDGANCYGEEKVNRLMAAYNLDDYSEIIVYGDSKGDFELFEMASAYFYKPFRKGSFLYRFFRAE